MKFNIGDKVKLVAHSMDTHVNLEIGYIGEIVRIQESMEQALLIKWNKYKSDGYWWVEKKTVRTFNLVLENK